MVLFLIIFNCIKLAQNVVMHWEFPTYVLCWLSLISPIFVRQFSSGDQKALLYISDLKLFRTYIAYYNPPSEQSETGGYTVCFHIYMSVCICTHHRLLNFKRYMVCTQPTNSVKALNIHSVLWCCWLAQSYPLPPSLLPVTFSWCLPFPGSTP